MPRGWATLTGVSCRRYVPPTNLTKDSNTMKMSDENIEPWLDKLEASRKAHDDALADLRRAKARHKEESAAHYDAWMEAGLAKRRLIARAIELGLPITTIAKRWGTSKQNILLLSQRTKDRS